MDELVTLARNERIGVTCRRHSQQSLAALIRVRGGGSGRFLDLGMKLDGRWLH